MAGRSLQETRDTRSFQEEKRGPPLSLNAGWSVVLTQRRTLAEGPQRLTCSRCTMQEPQISVKLYNS